MKNKKTKKIILIGFVFAVLSGLWAQDTRPIRDDIGYCWDSQQLDRLMDYLASASTQEETRQLPQLIAGISPHDDYLYAGPIYYRLFKHINAREVVIFGVTHSSVRKALADPQAKLIFDAYTDWKGPYKKVKISKLREYLKEKLDKQLYITSNEAHQAEHSIEAMIPFLQHFNREVRITPIMVTGMNFETMESRSGELASVIASYIKENNLKIGKDIFFLISADANHYGKDFDNIPYGEDEKAHQWAIERDQKIADSYLSGEMAPNKIKGLTIELWGKTYKDYKDTVWCGKYSIPFGMLTVIHLLDQLDSKRHLTGRILQFSDTYTGGVLPLKKAGLGITAPFSLKHWVSFFSAGYFMK
ncbi:MAG: AmmeMemoRadiSam system protein B [Candidatus Aminicenantes bacterium]|jgi:AmmeMemoRadiSam system protein B